MVIFFYQWLKYKLKIIHRDENFLPNCFSKNNILVIDRHIPFFDKDAGSFRMYNLLNIFQELDYHVTFIGDDFQHFNSYDSIFEQAGIQVVYSPQIKSIKQYLSRYGQVYNIVLLSRPDVAKKHIDTIRHYCRNAKIVYDTVDLRFLRLQRNAELQKDILLLRKAYKLKKMEIGLARKADVTLVVSSYEKDLLLHEDSSLNVQIVSLIYPISSYKENFLQRKDILFLGGFQHSPNIDGVLWFVNEILPTIKKSLPGIKFYIVGDNPPREIQELSSEDIIITGYISDLSYFLEKCRVFIAPLRYGAGIKGKICHSMSYGLPVVTTPIGAEGMGLIDGFQALIADSPIIFSEKVIRLYNDQELWNNLSQNSILHIKDNYSFEKGKKDVKNFIEILKY